MVFQKSGNNGPLRSHGHTGAIFQLQNDKAPAAVTISEFIKYSRYININSFV